MESEHWNESDLAAFIAFFNRAEPFAFLGGVLYTYPGDNDDQATIYALCCELERRNFVTRTVLDSGCVLFRRKAQRNVS